MLKMLLITVFILLEILSFNFAKSGRDELSHDAYADKLNNLASESINVQDSLTSLQFQPKILDFHERSIGDPHNHVVILFNKHKHKKVYLGSITGSSSDFYSSYFEEKMIPPESNTTFKVVFLPRQLGETNSSLIIHTSFGVINYQVRGIGVECQYKLKPLIGIKLPLNATISPEIQFYNPHNFALQISEIFSSGGDFQLELPNVSSGGQEGDYKLWEIPPFTTKSIIRVRFTGNRAGNHTAYVRIKIARTKLIEEKMLVVPIEIEIYNETGVYSQVPLLDFGMVGLDDGVRTYVYNLLNSAQTTVSIKNWGVESELEEVANSQCVAVDVVQFSRRNFTDHFTVEVDWSKCSSVSRIVTGNILLMSDISSYDKVDEITYRIPFFGHIIKGNLSYKSTDFMFLRSDKKSYEMTRSIIIKNNYNVPLAITNLSVPESCARYFKLTGFKSLVLQPGSLMKLLDIQPLNAQFAANQTTLDESFRLVTNVTQYDIPVKSYTGLLRRIVPVDFARERSQVDEKELNFGALLPVSKNSELLIAFVNDNPIPIEIKSWKGTITSGSGQAQITSIQRGCSKMSLDDLVFCNPSIKPNEWVVFAVSVQSPVVGSFEGNFVLKTPFEEINTPVRFSTAMGRLELKSKMIFDDCFPGKICSLNIEAYSTFMKKMYVEGIAVDMDGISYEFAVKGPNELPEILPNVDTDVGKLFFNPKDVLCKKRSTCYTSFEALSRPVGETWMRTLTNYSAYSRWDNERLKSQLSSFMEVKQSLKQMQFRLTTSQIRRYEFNASINFVWPRLMTGNVEFPFVQINKLETRFIEIFNPSNQLLYVHFVLHNVSQHGDKITVLPEALRDCPDCVLSHENKFQFNSCKNKDVFMDEVKPLSYLKVGIDFFATTPGTYSTLLYMRNNLTVVEAVWLSARAVVPQFKFGNRKPGNTTPLQFEISEKHLKLCEKKSSGGSTVLISSKRTFTAKNYGEVPLMINSMRIENDACLGYGFKVLNCEPFQLMPNESKKIEIAFSPDFTLSRVVRTLNFDTSIGENVNFTLIGTVASSALDLCGRNIQRPLWEADFKKNALAVLWIALIVVVLAAAIDSDRILKEHMRIMAREKGPVQPPLDLRQIGLDANITTEEVSSYGANQERLNKLNSHQTSLNSFRKRLTIPKKNCVSPETTSGRFSLNKPWADFRNKFTTTKVTPPTTPPVDPQSTKSSPKPLRYETSKGKTHQEIPKESKKTSITSEDDSVSSSSSKENCEVSSPKSSHKVECESPLMGKNKNSGRKSKTPLQATDNNKDPKTTSPSQITPVKPLNTSQNLYKSQPSVKEVKNKLQSPNNSSQSNVKLNGEMKSHSPTSNASSSEGHLQNNSNIGFNDITNGNESINLIKNEQQQLQQQHLKKHGKTPGRELKAGLLLNMNQMNNGVGSNSLSLKKAPMKDKFQVRQNLGSAFNNVGKFNNGHQNTYGPNNNWLPPANNNIWSNTSYSEVVAKTPIEPAPIIPMNHNYGLKNGMGNGNLRHADPDLIHLSNFPRNIDRYVEQEEGSQYGPIGTKKSPSSTPSWEPLGAGMTHMTQIAKPAPYNVSTYFSPPNQPVYGIQQSRLMNLMSYNDQNAQQLQQQQQNHLMEEQYRYQMLQMQERKQNEWRSAAAAAASSNSSNLWSPAYRRESPTAPPSNWSSPSPPLAVPPGFEQQFQQQQQPNIAQQIQPNATASQVIPAYDPFKSLSAIWEPNRNDNNERDTWNQ